MHMIVEYQKASPLSVVMIITVILQRRALHGLSTNPTVVFLDQSLCVRNGSPYVWSKFNCGIKVHYNIVVAAH